MKNLTANIQKQSGVSLVEVLIAALVLSIGILTAAALQASTLRSNQDSSLRTQAIHTANLVLDELRAQRGLPAGSIVNAADLNRWRDLAATVLPPPDSGGELIEVALNARVATVTVNWLANRGAQGADRDSSLTLVSRI